jgi:hypothetical protein
VVGLCEHGSELSVSIKGGEFLDYLSDCKLLKKDSYMELISSNVVVKNILNCQIFILEYTPTSYNSRRYFPSLENPRRQGSRYR